MPRLMALAALMAAIFMTGPASAACPPGSQFFAYGGSGGCVRPGTNQVVLKCFRMPKSCPSGWSQEHKDDKGRWCCPPPRKPTSEELFDRAYPNRTCMWRGTAPFCKGRCLPGELNPVASKDGKGTWPGFGAKCITGLKAYCCTPTFRRR